MAAPSRSRVVDSLCLAAVIFALSMLALSTRPLEGPAVWWPAAGVAAAWVLRRGGPDPILLAAVVVGTGVAGVAVGRPPLLAVLLGLACAVEVLVFAGYLARGRPAPFVLRDVGDVGALLMATVLGCLAGAVVAGTAVALVGDLTVHPGRFLPVSRGAAVLLIAPLVMTPRAEGHRSRWARVELAAQWGGVLAVTACVFRPGQSLPLAFLCLPLLVWAALRSGARATAWLLLALGVVVTGATIAGWGPFAAAGIDPRAVVATAQAFLLVSCSTLLVLAVAVAERARLTQRVSDREALYRSGFEDALLGMLLVGYAAGSLRVLEVNAVGARLLGSTPDALVGTELSHGVHPDDGAAFGAGALEVARGTAPGWRGEVRVGAPGRVRWMDVAVAPSRDRRSDPVLSVQLVDVTERHDAQAHLQRLALHDPLTGLPNRSLLLDRLEHALAACIRPGALVAAAYVDLDGFKAVNDRAGHAAGDAVLVVTARRLQAAVRPGDTVARVGGDEFVVVCPSVADEGDVQLVVDRLEAALSEPVVVDGTPYRVRASCGVAVGGPTTSAAALLRAAATPMDPATRRRTRRPAPALSVAAGPRPTARRRSPRRRRRASGTATARWTLSPWPTRG